LWALTDGATWLSMLVQAKRLYQQTERYEKLSHKVGTPPIDQIDILLSAASQVRASPAYFFYNFTSAQPLAPRVYWNCGTFPRRDRLFGCSVAEATAVKATLANAGDALSAISTVSFPFHCLVCCPVRGTSLPTTAHGILSSSRQMGFTVTDPSGISSADGLTTGRRKHRRGLYPLGNELVIGEGVETCMAARQLGFKPAWALGSVGSISFFPLIAHVERLVILGERGEASARAIKFCGKRWHRAGRSVRVVMPTVGNDVNDALIAECAAS
jgi:hypothetical protein